MHLTFSGHFRKSQVNSIIISEDIEQWLLLRWVLIPLRGKRPKCPAAKEKAGWAPYFPRWPHCLNYGECLFVSSAFDAFPAPAAWTTSRTNFPRRRIAVAPPPHPHLFTSVCSTRPARRRLATASISPLGWVGARGVLRFMLPFFTTKLSYVCVERKGLSGKLSVWWVGLDKIWVGSRQKYMLCKAVFLQWGACTAWGTQWCSKE